MVSSLAATRAGRVSSDVGTHTEDSSPPNTAKPVGSATAPLNASALPVYVTQRDNEATVHVRWGGFR